MSDCLRRGSPYYSFPIASSLSKVASADFIIFNAKFLVLNAQFLVTKLDLSGCPLTGGEYDEDYEKDLTGITALFEALKTSTVTELSLRKCRLGPGSMGKLAEYVREATAGVASLKLAGADFGPVYSAGDHFTVCQKGHQLIENAKDSHSCDVCRTSGTKFRCASGCDCDIVYT